MRLSNRFVRWIPAVALALVAPAAASAVGASLHTALKRSEPAADSRLDRAPTRVSLWFTGKPQVAFSSIRLQTPSGEIGLDSIVADTGFSLHAAIPQVLGPGTYTVIWRTASADGHPIRGEFAFTVSASAADTAPPTIADSSVVSGPVDAVHRETVSEYRTARWMEFVALLTILGALGFRHAVLPPLASRGVPTTDAADRARRLGQSVLVLYFVAILVRVYAEAAALSSPAQALSADVLFPLLGGTTWGFGWSAGLVGALVLLAGWAISRRSIAVGTPIALTGAFAMVLSPALTGHAAASRNFVLGVTLDVLHVGAAGLWLGGLLMVLLVGIPAMRRLTDGNPDAAVSALVNSFHPLALFCAPIVVIAGLGSGWLRLGDIDALTSTRYGETLLWKLALVVLLIALGAYNSSRARKRLGTTQGTSAFRRSAAIELLLAALVLAATTRLITTPMPISSLTP
ncbi:MAG TPA: copper resistance protein CopC [Gemmatimonadaceae bacterium]|nr:copper resistance protein CopC [Gemmatimonadaceae bacterium]